MTNLPDDLLDPVEARLARRVRGYSDAAVAPIDPVAIAASAAATRPRRFASIARSLPVLAGAAAVAIAAVLVGMSTLIIGGPPDSPGGPVASAPATGASAPGTGDAHLCAAETLTARIVGWDGAAGSRIAAVELAHTGSAECSIPSLGPLRLIDSAGTILIDGTDVHAGAKIKTITMAPGGVVHANVVASNYCGAPAVEPATIAFDLNDRTVFATPAPGGLSGVPPCNGASAGSSISMTNWQPGPAAP